LIGIAHLVYEILFIVSIGKASDALIILREKNAAFFHF
jgi:hypothetical protein